MIYICGGLMRTGSIAMWQVMDEIAQVAGGQSPMLGTELNEVLSLWRDIRLTDNPLLVTKLHRYEKDLDRYDKHIKVVLTVRDFRDVVVSLLHFKGTTFENEMHSRAYTTWLDSYKSWYESIHAFNVMEIRYEDFIANRKETILKVAKFMEISLDDVSAGHIDNKWSIASNIRRSTESHAVNTKEFMAERHIYSKGESKWKKELTVAQVEHIMTPEMTQWLEEHGYTD